MKNALVCTWLTAALLSAAAPGRPGEFDVALAETAPPAECSKQIAEAVGSGSFAVSRGGEAMAEFWLREEPPLADPPDEVLEVSFGGLREAELVGVVRISRAWREYKGLAVEPGVYTLRYARRPADGNHMGVSMYRDFLLLVPVADDATAAVEWSTEELYAKSTAVTGQPHPASLALFPVWEEVAEARILANDVGQPMLAVPLGPFAIGLTVEGEGAH